MATKLKDLAFGANVVVEENNQVNMQGKTLFMSGGTIAGTPNICGGTVKGSTICGGSVQEAVVSGGCITGTVMNSGTIIGGTICGANLVGCSGGTGIVCQSGSISASGWYPRISGIICGGGYACICGISGTDVTLENLYLVSDGVRYSVSIEAGAIVLQ